MSDQQSLSRLTSLSARRQALEDTQKQIDSWDRVVQTMKKEGKSSPDVEQAIEALKTVQTSVRRLLDVEQNLAANTPK